MSNGTEREWLVFLMGPAGIVRVVVQSASAPEVSTAEVRLGDSRFLREFFAGALPNEKVTQDQVYPASG
jgi:hypothetical protein